MWRKDSPPAPLAKNFLLMADAVTFLRLVLLVKSIKVLEATVGMLKRSELDWGVGSMVQVISYPQVFMCEDGSHPSTLQLRF
jgi:hypothetical protein